VAPLGGRSLEPRADRNMHLPAFLRTLLITVFLSASILSASAQDSSGSNAERDTSRKYGNISFAEPESRISDPALIPVQLVLAAEQARCDYKRDIKEIPIQLIRTDGRRIALVFCRLGVGGSHHVFDFADLKRPTLVQLPFIATKQGFGVTHRPGMVTWKRDTGEFEAVIDSDMCSSPQVRHTYRVGTTEGPISGTESFVVVRVEAREGSCGRNTNLWTTVWEAPAWPKSVAVP
jgi:hypothetical protein